MSFVPAFEKKVAQKNASGKITYIDSKNYIEQSIKEILRNIKSIPAYISRIDNKNNRYVTKTISTIHYLINRGQDIEGTLNRLIEYVKEDKVTDNIFNMLDMNYYSFNRLSKPKSKNIIINPGMMELNLKLSEEEKEKTKKIIDEELKYSIESVNEYVTNVLSNNNTKRVSEMKLETKDDFMMVIAILMHSKSPISKYYVSLTNDKYENDYMIITDFIIKKKGV